MVNFGKEADFGRGHWIFSSKEELEVEKTALVGGVDGACNLYFEVSRVVGRWLRVDSYYWLVF